MKEFLERIKAFIVQHVKVVCFAAGGALTLITVLVLALCLRVVVIDDNGQRQHVPTFLRERDAILRSVGVTVWEHDMVTDTLGNRQPTITIDRAMAITLNVDGKTTVVRLQSGTVADALKAADLQAATHDLAGGTLTDTLYDGMTVTLHELKSELRTEKIVLAHGENVTYTDTVPKGSRIIKTAGVDGEVERVYRDYYRDGKVVVSEPISEIVTKDPVTEIAEAGVGSVSRSPIPLELDENGRPTQYKDVLTGDACAYYFKRGTGTATGTMCKAGVVAVNPDIIPYGSKLFIIADDGYVYGYAEARDTGLAVRDNIILVDLFMESYRQTCKFGRRHVSVYILE